MLKPRYIVPKTIEEACALLSKYKDDARVIAGGTDLVLQMKHREVLPKYVINIAGISCQDYIKYGEEEGLRIGALTTMNSIRNSAVINRLSYCPLRYLAATIYATLSRI